MKSVFFGAEWLTRVRSNLARQEWAVGAQAQILQAAQPWLDMSDEALWRLMFGNTISRSWMVWSNGYCPACRQDVRMYAWEIDALRRPWKARCPHCEEIFPKNDFHAFYRSGLDEQNIYNPGRADRSLLFNLEHPDPDDPLQPFGVDDGEGYREIDAQTGAERCWRFIGAYLIYGQWKQLVVGGICNLAAAHVVTGDPVYAHKAGVLLDRVADLYPTFDFKREGVMYEGPGAAGYVSTWHDACEETREMVLACDQVREALAQDEGLAAFLAGKAAQHGLDRPKTSPQEVQRNIEERILRDALENAHKIHSNYPRTEIALITIQAVLGWPENRDEVWAMLDQMLEKATAVDGVTGEKGLDGYAAGTIQSVAPLLGLFARIEPGFLERVYLRHPRLRGAYRFHIDTWCMQQYYPRVGDCSGFARKDEEYAGLRFASQPGKYGKPLPHLFLAPSMYSFLWRLYELTGDVAFVQILYRANGHSVEGLPYDLLAEGDPQAFQQGVQEIIDRHGAVPQVESVDKKECHLALLRSGRGADERVLWMTYDTGGGHSHRNGMNVGLFAKGLDLMPDFGYPQVQYEGWSGPKFDWYLSTAAHNTVLVDGQNQPRPRGEVCAGQTTLWADGEQLRAIRVSGPDLNHGRRFERTVALIELSEGDAYVWDVFRVAGGTTHDKFQHSHFGRIVTRGLSLGPIADEEVLRHLGPQAQMRGFNRDPSPQLGWSVDWEIEDRYGYLPEGSEIHLRYTDLTVGAQALTCEGWVTCGFARPLAEAWIPRVLVRRRLDQPGEEELVSTFVAVAEPYEGASNISQIRRLSLQTSEGEPCSDANVAVEIQLADGRRDLLVAVDVEGASGTVVQPEWNVRLDGEVCMVRLDAGGKVERIALCKGSAVHVGGRTLRSERPAEGAGQASLCEVSFSQDGSVAC